MKFTLRKLLVPLGMTIILLDSMAAYKPSGGWLAPELSTYLTSHSFKTHILDPENILSPKAYQDISQILKQLENLPTLFILISKINDRNWNYKRDQIDAEAFLKEFRKSTKHGRKLDGHSIILYSLIDDIDFWKLTRNFKRTIGRFLYKDIQMLTRKELKKRTTDATFVNLFTNIYETIKYRDIVDKVMSWILAILIGFTSFYYLNNIRKEHLLRIRIKQIRKIEKEYQSIDQILDKVCLICLEKLPQRGDDSEKGQNIENLSQEDSSADAKNYNNEAFEAQKAKKHVSQFVSCRHVFHIPCFDSWYKEYDECPICFVQSFKNKGQVDIPINEVLLKIQKMFLKSWFFERDIDNRYQHYQFPSDDASKAHHSQAKST